VPEPLAIETVGLRKSYATTEALRGLDLRVPAGSICGFLGRNGAGKTTTLKVLLGMTRASHGQVRVLGLAADDPASSLQIRRRTGFVSETKDLYDYMTVAEIVRFTARFYSQWNADAEQRHLRRFELPLDRKVKTLSRGMRTQLALLLALCRGTELLILDEPTSGLDPVAREDALQALVAHMARERATVFLSSHDVAEIEQVADHVAIVDRGRTVANMALDDLRERHCRIQMVFDGEAPQPSFRAPGVSKLQRSGRLLTLLSTEGSEAVVAEAHALGPVSVEISPLSLKDIFLESVGGES
jgi:ABC-2 type transport system ATP-binding protein